jgi:uncharacterized protein (TIGR00251 family)
VSLPAFARSVSGGIELRLKVVPGASRTAVAGPLGDRLKLRVAAPPEAGKANAEVIALLERELGGRAELIAGHTNALKTVVVRGVASERCERWASGF